MYSSTYRITLLPIYHDSEFCAVGLWLRFGSIQRKSPLQVLLVVKYAQNLEEL